MIGTGKYNRWSTYDHNGMSVLKDGTIVAIGSNDGNGDNAGHVRIYNESTG